MKKTYAISLGGLYTGLILVFLYLSRFLPFNKLFLLAAASSIIPLAIITIEIKYSSMVYFASTILSLVLGLRGVGLVYGVFFGLYGFVKYYIERLQRLPLEWILKFAFFNFSMFIMYQGYRLLLLPLPVFSIPLPAIILMLQLVFFIYDYALTVFITYVNRRLLKR